MNKIKLPSIGGRNLKTALAAFICIVLFDVVDKPSAFFACVAALMCMQDTVENSLKMGKNRVIGTLIGGIIGLFIVFLSSILGDSLLIFAILTALGTILSIYSCVLFSLSGAVNSACIVLFAIMTNLSAEASYGYAINRTIDTFAGVIIGVLVNRFVCPYNKSKNKELTNKK